MMSPKWSWEILVSFVLILRAYDVSAQTSCVISPDLDMLTIKNPLGRNVDLHCQCMDDNGIITGTRWFLPNMNVVSTDNSNRPYSTGTAPSRLIFTNPFTNSDAGTYTCSPNSTFPTIPPGDSVTLSSAVDPGYNANCSIVSTNLPTVTAAGGVIANGTQNVILYCICMRVNSIVTVGLTTWYFNGVRVTLTQDDGSGNPYSRNNVPSTLIIPSFVAPHDGDYSCAHGSIFSDVATLGDTITLTLPAISPSGPIQGAMVGSPLVINCTVSAVRGVQSNSVIISWMGPVGNIINDSRMAISPTTSNNNTYSSSLQFIYLMEGDEGTYTCNVMILDTSGSQSFEIKQLTTPIPTVYIVPSGTQIAGHPLKLQCNGTTVRGITSRVDIVWSSGGTELQRMNNVSSTMMNNSLVYTNSYTISQLSTTDDERVIQCEVVINTSPLVMAGNSISLNVIVITPVITKHPADNTIELFSNFTNLILSCEADGASSYKWERQNGDIPSDSTGVTTNTLTLINLQPEDAGNYRCVATNASGSNASNYATVTITICAPHIIAHPTNTSAAAPFGAEFNCSIQVYGYLTVTWYKSNEKPVPSKAYSTVIQSMNGTTSTLTIPNVTSEDVSTYYCEAWANRRAAQSLKADLFLAESPIPPVVMTDPVINITVNDYILVMKCLPDKINFNYKWIKKNNVLPSRAQGANSSQLTIINLKPEDSGDYQCVMSNRTGRISSSFLTVHVRVSLPIISKQPNHVNTNVLSSVSFNCIAYAYGELKIVWKRLKYNMPVTAEVTEQKSLNEIDSILKFTNTIGYYSGQYYCVAENEVGKTVSQTANLSIQAPKPEIIISPEDVTVLPNHSFTMSCLASSFGLLQYDWSKRGGILPQTVVKSFVHDILFNPLTEKPTNIYTLAVDNVQLSDEGWYCCVVTNDAGSTEDCAWLEIDTLPNITVQPAPQKLKKEDMNITAISCTAIGMGPINYKWEKYYSSNNSWISPSHRAINITSPDLIFSVISEEDEGVYRCNVTNDDGSVISNNATILVYGPPIIIFASNYTVSIEGDKVNLICSAVNDVDASHPLQMNWYKGSKLIMEDNKRIIIHTVTGEYLNSTLLLDPVNRTDDGVYTFRFFNRNDSFSESKINLTVQYPVFVSILNKSPYTTSVGNLAILYCEATGKPIPLVQWFKDDIPVTLPSQMRQSFKISTNTSHTTIYTCRGINYVGNIRHTRYANISVNVKVVKPCLPLLDAPENGNRTTIREYGIVKYISFACNLNYVLKGKTLATCDNGTWSSSTPSCNKP